EREALDEQERHDLIDDTTAQDLETDLSVAHIQPEENAVQALVTPARDSPRARIVDYRLRVAFRTDREVELLAPRDLEEGGNGSRSDAQIRVDKRYPVTARSE